MSNLESNEENLKAQEELVKKWKDRTPPVDSSGNEATLTIERPDINLIVSGQIKWDDVSKSYIFCFLKHISGSTLEEGKSKLYVVYNENTYKRLESYLQKKLGITELRNIYPEEYMTSLESIIQKNDTFSVQGPNKTVH